MNNYLSGRQPTGAVAAVAVDQFGYRIRQHLTAVETHFPERIDQKLAAARALALQRAGHGESFVYAPRLAHAGGPSSGFGDGMNRWAIIFSLLILIAGVFAISEWQQQRYAEDMAEVDTAILTEDLPFTTHLDPAFITMLEHAQ